MKRERDNARMELSVEKNVKINTLEYTGVNHERREDQHER